MEAAELEPPLQLNERARWQPGSEHEVEMNEPKVTSDAAASQLRVLPGESWEDIFSPQPTIGSGQLAPGPEPTRGAREPRPREGSCKWCGLPIRWETTEKNRRPLPVDIEPSHDECCGNFVLVDRDGQRVARYVNDVQRIELIRLGTPVWVAHQATCTRRRAA